MKPRTMNAAGSRRNPEVSKWVTVTLPGYQYGEHRILISPYSIREFENLLTHLTDKLKPSFGAIWRLFTEEGHEIKSLEEVKGGCKYVASGRAKPFNPLWASFSKPRQSRRELRSHSAVGALCTPGGSGVIEPDNCEVGACSRCSDSNLKPKSGHGQCRSAPRRRKVGEQMSDRNVHPMWDQPHLDQQSHRGECRGGKKNTPDMELSGDIVETNPSKVGWHY